MLEKEQRIKNILKKKKEIDEKRHFHTVASQEKPDASVSARNNLSLSNGSLLLRSLGSCKKLSLRKSPAGKELTKNASVRLLSEIMRSAEANEQETIVNIAATEEGRAFPKSDRVWVQAMPLKQREFFKRIENDCIQRR